jgi:hypothetical protein
MQVAFASFCSTSSKIAEGREALNSSAPYIMKICSRILELLRAY